MPTPNPNPEILISYRTLRKAIGWLGMLLPFVLLIGNYCINRWDLLNNTFFVQKCNPLTYTPDDSFKTSISHYYYSTVGELFTGVLSAVALFMFCYRGHPKRPGEKGLSDRVLTNLAGIFAFGVVIFPTSADDCIKDNIRSFLSSENTGNIHFTFAALFFVSLAIMSIVNFRRSEIQSDFGKGRYDTTHLVCGIGMLVSLAMVFLYVKFLKPHHIECLDKIHPVFCLEAISLFFFGISWLLKGEVDLLYIPKKIGLLKK